MNHYSIILLLLTALPAHAAEPLPEAAHSTIGYASVAEALIALQSRTDVEARETSGWLVFTDASHTLWSFAPESHAAYPAVAKRVVVENNGAVYLETSVQCEASKSACDQLVREFQALNDHIAEKFKPNVVN